MSTTQILVLNDLTFQWENRYEHKKSQHSVISAREVEMEESSKIHVRTEKGDILWGSELKFLRVDAFWRHHIWKTLGHVL